MYYPPSKRRFTFGLRTLLLLVLSCAIGFQWYVSRYSALEKGVRRLKQEMSMQQVHQAMGPPIQAFPATTKWDVFSKEIYYEGGRMWKPYVWATVRYLDGKMYDVVIERSDHLHHREHWIPLERQE